MSPISSERERYFLLFDIMHAFLPSTLSKICLKAQITLHQKCSFLNNDVS